MHATAADTLRQIWREARLPEEALGQIKLTGEEPVLPSSFAIGVAAQSSIGSAALAAAEIWHARTGRRQRIGVDLRAAALECLGWFSLDGRAPEVWDKLSGLYPCGEDAGEAGFVRIHANFAHHRDGALKLLGLKPGDSAEKNDVTRALRRWRARDFEQQAADAGLVVSALRSFAEWDAHPQSRAVATEKLVGMETIGAASRRPLTPLDPAEPPLKGIRVLDLTRILAGPVGGRTLAAYGADVMLVNSPHLPNIEAIADTSRGKLSVHLDLATELGRTTLRELVREADIFVQGYRPGGIAALGFGPEELAALKPGIVCVSLSAYGYHGPWASRRGFDSLVQTSTGFNHAEGEAFDGSPRALPVQALDFCAGFLMAFGGQAARLRQAREGGSWHVRVSLARTAHWLRGLGRVPNGAATPKPEIAGLVKTYESGFGRLVALPHAATFSATPPHWSRRSMPPGSHRPEWPARN